MKENVNKEMTPDRVLESIQEFGPSKELVDKLISFGDPKYIYLASRFVKGEALDTLYYGIKDTENAQYITKFCRDVANCDVTGFINCLDEATIEDKVYFVKGTFNFDFIIEDGKVKLNKLAKKFNLHELCIAIALFDSVELSTNIKERIPFLDILLSKLDRFVLRSNSIVSLEEFINVLKDFDIEDVYVTELTDILNSKKELKEKSLKKIS